ncbi:hypothetical protein TWF730_006077 [Orbilia blumenaviensis]|uniref:Actin-like ATPase domain-containing protein n=1 Tax=Orbilia blumenaviensis TaxID=1796055 RepID=A0AAV9TWL1_9PEZI
MVSTRPIESQRYHLIVGVDYGTTYSGLSFILSRHNDPSEIRDYTEWPSNTVTGHTQTGLKTPSRIAYAEDNKISKNRWGYEVGAGLKQYSWMKLHLDKEADPTDFDDPDLSEEITKGIIALGESRSAEDITSDYLKELYVHLMGVLEKKYTKPVLQVTSIKFWLTKPAIWSDKAEVKTLRAAKKAGFGSRPGDEICLILEPEAAALATITGLSREFKTAAKPGDSIIVCDCGGGTVDLTGYVIAEKNQRLVLHETCPAIGGKCGGTAVDRNLRKWMSRRYGESFDSLPEEFKGPGSEFMQGFEWNKRKFGTPDDFDDMILGMDDVDPDDEYYDESWEKLAITNEVMRELFEPVIQKIIDLVQTQIDRVRKLRKKPVNKLFLVGGFGDSAYLQQRLASYLRPQNIIVNFPGNKSWGAVAKGAVVRGLEMATIDTRRCRTSYGTEIIRPFREGIDQEEDSFIHPFLGKVASGYMQWCVLKGTEITNDTSITLGFQTVIEIGAPSTNMMQINLLYCDDDLPPDRYSKEAVKLVGNIKPDLKEVDLTKFASTGDGRLVNLAFQIEIMLGDKQGTILFQCIVQGEVVGDTEIDFSEHVT